MSVYMVFIREGEVVDAEAMAKYQSGNRGGPPPEGMKALAVYGAMETLEGEGADGIVILEFPDRDAANAWYHSDEYQARAKFRMQAAPYRCFMVVGL